MVNWVAPAPGVTPGAISAYSASDGALLERRIQLTTAGTLDLVASGGGLTRVGLPVAIPPTSIYSDARGPFPSYGIHGEATFFMTPEDFDDFSEISQSDGRMVGFGVLTAMMAWAPASAFPGTGAPTPEQIYNAGRATGSISFSRNVAPRPAGAGENFTFAIKGPLHSDLAPNTKYWVTVFPAIAFRAATLLFLPDLMARPLFLIPDEPRYAGRAVSFITARPPAAPVITSPVESIYANPGDTITLEFDPVSGNPDRVTPPGGTVAQPSHYSGIAGVQVQMASIPTFATSHIIWNDLPIADSATEAGRGWYIDAEAPASYGPGTGARTVWENFSVPIKCGTSVRTANHANLPPGNFLVRVRVFTYGHPYPATNQAIKGSLRYSTSPSPVTPYNLSPDESAVVASPWSRTVTISSAVQVPPPIPLSPREGEAVVVGKPTTFRWRYRNTHVDSYVQSQRTVQYRVAGPGAPGTKRDVGAGPWVTAATGHGLNHETSHVLDLDVNTEYEWRVRVTDSSAVQSEWSETARFWAVPAPTSGGSATLPISSLDLATLGNGTHRVFLYRRGGKQRVGEIRNCSLVEWNRLRDDISDARVITTDWDLDEGAMLAHIQTWAYELVIFRDNGSSVDRVWEGPVARLTYTKDSVEIYARDMMAYAYRRVIRQKMNDGGGNNTGATVVDRATRVLQNAFAPDDPNVLAYLHPIEDGNPAMQYRSAAEYSRTAFEEVDDMASNAGLDYTVVGRSILLWGTRHPLGRLPEFRDKDLGASPIVSEYGMSLSNRYIVSDGNGIWGQAEIGPLKETGEDPKYGLVEILSSSWASDEDEDDEEGADYDYGVITEEQRAKIVASFEEHAAQSIASRYPAPVVVRVPDNTSLNPSAVVSIQHLVPGVAIPLRSTSTLREVSALQKLDSVRVTETEGKEVVAVTMSPFNRRDNEMGEGEEVE